MRKERSKNYKKYVKETYNSIIEKYNLNCSQKSLMYQNELRNQLIKIDK
jgi:hypothetical protein